MAALLATAALSCTGLSEADKAKLDVHEQNARSFFDGGDYQRALHQATSALELAPDDIYMGLVRGHCLLRLGTAAKNSSVLDDSVATFEGMLSNHSDDDRISLGAASAHLGRALLAVDEIDRTQQRLDSEFLDATARGPETARLKQQQAAHTEHLRRAEELLNAVLEHPLQKDNPIALTDLVLVLHAEDGRDSEALPLANRTLELLDESTEMTRTTMDTNKRLTSAERLTLQARLDQNKEKEQALRDLLASAALARGDTDGFLAQMSALEARDMLGESQYYSRAGVYEKLGKVDLAIADLETFLKLRSRRYATYADDDMAPKVFERLETLRGQQASPPR